MNLISIVLFLVPFVFLIAFFIGLVKKNKRLWITALILFTVILLAEIAYFNFTV
ncbi:hypothetical protein [Maribellus sp. YY47]|uniref:hypothetical protein n=1 Tax=Maribellus sp. YY47 TaxID=2929486 RepID=UPI0020016F9A|nr:hypothetical protein [Maribellus sp. YY47]MCK3683193.1 hypothetical protein [Maribellus sp. YY47]